MRFICLVLLVGCVSEGDDEGGAATTQDSTCVSGVRWTGGDSESPLMHPGGDCIGCHASGEGPRFIVAGTVYSQLVEKTDCFGVSGVTVTLTDANNVVVTTTSNDAGNFYFRATTALTMPVHATLSYEGRTRQMVAAQGAGLCASCHTETGANGAPGRIMAP